MATSLPSRPRLRDAATVGLVLSLVASSVAAQTGAPAADPAPSVPGSATPAASASAGPAASGSAAPTSPAAPDPHAPKPLAETLTGEAKSEYEAGRLAFQAGDYATASVKFAAAHDRSHDARLLFNMAVCARKLNKWSRVLTYIERYKKEGGVLLSAEDRKDADELIAAVRSFVSPLRLTIDPPGATVFVDDEEVGVSPIAEPVLVDAGQRRIRVSKKGFQDFQRVEDAPGGREIAAAISLKPAKGTLLVTAGATDTIAVDGTVVGVGRWEGSVPSGTHTIRVSGKGMRPQNQELVVKDDEVRRVEVTLASESATPLWAYIGGGVLIAAGIAGGSYLLLRDDKKETRPPVQGSLGTFSLPLLR
jgi:hypothetical protein